MKTRVAPRSTGVEIEITQVEGKEQRLLEAFQACQEGRCTCPTQEYEKLASLQIQRGEGTIALQLEAKAGLRFDLREIERCLEHTEANLSS